MKPIETVDDIKELSTQEINERWDEVKSVMSAIPSVKTIEYDPQAEWAQKGYKPIEIINKRTGTEPNQGIKLLDTKLKKGNVRIGLKNMTVDEINNVWASIVAHKKNK